MKRALVAVLLCGVLSPVLFAKRRAVSPTPRSVRAGQPVAGLSPELLARFFAGLEEFNKRQKLVDGLGPVLNGMDCVQCHSVPAPGGAGGGGTAVTRFGTMTNGVFDPLVRFGGP